MTLARWWPLLVALWGITATACDAEPAPVLDAPEILAIRADPPRLGAGPVVLTAFGHRLDDSALRWEVCSAVWAPGDPPTCPAGDPQGLAPGNPATLVDDDNATALWVQLFSDAGDLLPAVRRLARDGPERNPEPGAIVAPEAVAPGGEIDVSVAFDPGAPVDDMVITWYVTAGELTPRRALASRPVTLTAPGDPVVITLIAVVRDPDGGVAWRQATVTVR